MLFNIFAGLFTFIGFALLGYLHLRNCVKRAEKWVEMCKKEP